MSASLSCSNGGSLPEFPEKPSREAYEGFEWETVTGAGLKFWAQKNGNIRMLADHSVPGAVMVRDGDASPATRIKIFSLENGTINDLLMVLGKQPGWDAEQTCMFQEIPSNRKGVKRYILKPSGKYADEINSISKNEPVPSTCSGWGVGNSGMRYFEIHDNAPDKALFIEIGQDAPLFDENSIVFCEETPVSDELSKTSLTTMAGILTLAHEIRSFEPEGSDGEYWIVDKTGSLEDRYDRLTGGIKNGQPVRCKLKLEYAGKWDDGFAADYSGVFFVREIISMGNGGKQAWTSPQTLSYPGSDIRFTVSTSGDVLRIQPQGLSVSCNDETHDITGYTVSGVETGDLNVDGYPELFIYLTSEGSGSYGKLIGYSVNNGKSMSMVYLPEIADDPELKEGYMGHDEMAIVENAFCIRYPVYKDGDSNACPSGGMRQTQSLT